MRARWREAGKTFGEKTTSEEPPAFCATFGEFHDLYVKGRTGERPVQVDTKVLLRRCESGEYLGQYVVCQRKHLFVWLREAESNGELLKLRWYCTAGGIRYKEVLGEGIVIDDPLEAVRPRHPADVLRDLHDPLVPYYFEGDEVWDLGALYVYHGKSREAVARALRVDPQPCEDDRVKARAHKKAAGEEATEEEINEERSNWAKYRRDKVDAKLRAIESPGSRGAVFLQTQTQMQMQMQKQRNKKTMKRNQRRRKHKRGCETNPEKSLRYQTNPGIVLPPHSEQGDGYFRDRAGLSWAEETDKEETDKGMAPGGGLLLLKDPAIVNTHSS